MKTYSIFTVPTGVQPGEYGLEWLRKVLGYTNSKYTELDYDMRIKNGNGYKVYFTLKQQQRDNNNEQANQ